MTTPLSRLRPATLDDLDALAALEEVGFPKDQYSRKQLRYLLSRANAATWVIEEDTRILAYAMMLWRKGSRTGHLYSIVTHPEAQGRGLGGRLMEVCEQEAVRQGCSKIMLEVRQDNPSAIAFYERRGFKVVEELPGFYTNGVNGQRMVKELEHRSPEGVYLDVPYYSQTLEFTCGPACLMMGMKRFDRRTRLNRSLELMLWKEATLIFMTEGLGGCGPFGLALAAARRGFDARVILADRRVPFLSTVRSKVKKEVIRLVHTELRAQARTMGVTTDYFNFTVKDITDAVQMGAVPIVLISTYRLHRVKAPHWVVVTGFDDENIYVHDPYEGFYIHDKSQAQNIRIPRSEFKKMHRYGKDLNKSVVFIMRSKRED